jgi:hypothetical protein
MFAEQVEQFGPPERRLYVSADLLRAGGNENHRCNQEYMQDLWFHGILHSIGFHPHSTTPAGASVFDLIVVIVILLCYYNTVVIKKTAEVFLEISRIHPD